MQLKISCTVLAIGAPDVLGAATLVIASNENPQSKFSVTTVNNQHMLFVASQQVDAMIDVTPAGG